MTFLALLFALHAHAFTLSDVSVLLPLQTSSLLSPYDTAASGALIPRNIYDKFDAFAFRRDNGDLYMHYFRAIGIRLDPCFTEGSGPQKCRHQIRFVWQPVIVNSQGERTTLDSAMHSFYEFSDEREWSEIVREWPSSPNDHEPLNAQGTTWTKLRALLLKHVGAGRLIRVTAMRNILNDWIFEGIDTVDMSTTKIARVSSKSQQLFNIAFPRTEFEGEIDPKPDTFADWSRFAANSRETVVDNLSVMNEALSIEDPRKNNPGTVDCVSCHIAQNVLTWGSTHSAKPSIEAFASPFNLANPTKQFATDNTRAFGYFGKFPAISQRTINETAAVLASLNNASLDVDRKAVKDQARR